MQLMPQELKHECDVPVSWRGLSVFGLPGLLRNGMRSGFGKDMLDYDQANAYFEAAWEIVVERSWESRFAVLHKVVFHRADFYADVMRLSHYTSKETKTKTLAAAFLQGLDDTAPEPLRALKADMKKLYLALAEESPDRMKKVESWNTARPYVTHGAYLFMDKERCELNKMIAATKKVMCPEADGVVVLNVTTDDDQAIRASTKRRLVIKPYPQNMKQWQEMAQERYPNLDFKTKARISWDEVRAALKTTTASVEYDGPPKEGPGMSIHTDFALVIAATLEGRVFVTDKLHFFDEHDCIWKITDFKPLPEIIRAAVHSTWGHFLLTGIMASYKCARCTCLRG